MNQMTRRSPRWLQNDIFGSSDPRFLWPVSRLHQEMNRLFSDAFRGIDEGAEEGGGWAYNPVVDVEQQEDQYEISVELPGVAMNDINVEMKDDVLVVSGSKERKTTTGKGEQQRSERIYGSFQRSFRLPDDAVEDQINARFSDGVLTVSIPREQEQARVTSRRIEIQDASAARSAGKEGEGRGSGTSGGRIPSQGNGGDEAGAQASE